MTKCHLHLSTQVQCCQCIQDHKEQYQLLCNNMSTYIMCLLCRNVMRRWMLFTPHSMSREHWTKPEHFPWIKILHHSRPCSLSQELGLQWHATTFWLVRRGGERRVCQHSDESCVAHLVEHGVCNTRVVGLLPTGDQHEKSKKMYALWIKVSSKWLKCQLYEREKSKWKDRMERVLLVKLLDMYEDMYEDRLHITAEGEVLERMLKTR